MRPRPRGFSRRHAPGWMTLDLGVGIIMALGGMGKRGDLADAMGESDVTAR